MVGAAILDENKEVLVITENGYGKRTKASEYPVKGRGGKGLRQQISLRKWSISWFNHGQWG